jgi:hypothetical protein
LLRCHSAKASLAESQNVGNLMPVKDRLKAIKTIAKALKLKSEKQKPR